MSSKEMPGGERTLSKALETGEQRAENIGKFFSETKDKAGALYTSTKEKVGTFFSKLGGRLKSGAKTGLHAALATPELAALGAEKVAEGAKVVGQGIETGARAAGDMAVRGAEAVGNVALEGARLGAAGAVAVAELASRTGKAAAGGVREAANWAVEHGEAARAGVNEFVDAKWKNIKQRSNEAYTGLRNRMTEIQATREAARLTALREHYAAQRMDQIRQIEMLLDQKAETERRLASVGQARSAMELAGA